MPDEDMDPRIVKASEDAGLDPAALDWHVEAVHGWESHDEGFVERGLAGAVTCLQSGGCEEGIVLPCGCVPPCEGHRDDA